MHSVLAEAQGLNAESPGANRIVWEGMNDMAEHQMLPKMRKVPSSVSQISTCDLHIVNST